MSEKDLRQVFSNWSVINDRLTESIAGRSSDDLALTAGPGRWPLWAVVGHLACQRVFWFCDFAGEPGASTTPFTNAIWSCPGDEDLENVLDAEQLVDALTSTYAIVDGVLSRWNVEQFADVLSQPTWDDSWVHTRGEVVQRVYTHDVWHAAEVNEILTGNGLPGFDPWNASD